MNYCPYHTKSNNSLTIEEANEELKQKKWARLIR